MIDACSLQPDIDLLPFGDQTEIGERVGGASWQNGGGGGGVGKRLLRLQGHFLLHPPNPNLPGHQPERGPAAEDLRGPSALPEHQHRLPGEPPNSSPISPSVSL